MVRVHIKPKIGTKAHEPKWSSTRHKVISIDGNSYLIDYLPKNPATELNGLIAILWVSVVCIHVILDIFIYHLFELNPYGAYLSIIILYVVELVVAGVTFSTTFASLNAVPGVYATLNSPTSPPTNNALVSL